MVELALESVGENCMESTEHPVAIARYRILRLIGEGGMGSVYEAEQDLPRRIVALKIVKPSLATPELLRSFELESHALGRLQHPGIAQIYEAGTADTGRGPQPYFVMEFIRGKKLTDYAEEHHLNTRERMEMMSKIAEAVHHAHQRGLIHRDLKPANILVDETGQPKIVDFGVARTTDGNMQVMDQADMGQLVGTLAYMSPEQVLADPLELDTRSDVYSLGVILYELLAGRLPYTISRKLHENIQAIREGAPVKLSAVNRTYRGDIETIVGKALEKDKAMRYASATEIAADIHRYLRDEPIAARPASASYQLRKFARRNKALVAGVAAVFVVLVGGVVAFAWMANLYHLAAKKAVAENGKAEAIRNFTGVCLFGMANPSTQSDPSSPNPEITLKEAMDSCVKRIPAQFVGRPLLEAAVREFAADTYTGMGRYIEAKDQLEPAMALYRHQLPATDPETLKIVSKLADAYSNLKRYSTAATLAKQVVIDARSANADADRYVRKAISTLVFIYGGSLANADQAREFSQIDRFFKEDVIGYHRRKSGEGSSIVQFAVGELLSLYTESKPSPKYTEAVAFMKGIANDWRGALGEGSPQTLKAEKQLIGLYLIPQLHKHAEAEAYLKVLVDAQRRTLGDDDPATQATINYLVSVYLNQPQPRYAEAEALLKRVTTDARREFGSDSRAVRNASIGLADLYFRQGLYREATDLLIPLASKVEVERALANPATLETRPVILHNLDRSQIYGQRFNFALVDSMALLTTSERPTVLDALELLAQIYHRQGDSSKAQAVANELRTVLESALNSERKVNLAGKGSATVLKSMGAFAIRYIDQERYADAQHLLNIVVDGYRQLTASEVTGRRNAAPVSLAAIDDNPGNDSQVGAYQLPAESEARDVASILTSAAITYSRKGVDLQAENVLKEIRDIDFDVMGKDHLDTQRSLWRLASWYMDRARYREARATFDNLGEIQAKYWGQGHPITRTTMIDIVGLYWDRFQIESAEGKRENLQLLLRTNLEIREKLLLVYRTEPDGETSGNSRMMISNIGIMLAMLEQYQRAAETFKQLIAIHETAQDVQREAVPAAIADLGWTQFHQRNLVEAEASLRKALGLYEEIDSDSWERHNTESMLGATLAAAGKYEEANRRFINSDEKLRLRSPVPGPASGFTAERERGERILAMFKAWGKRGEETKWLQKMKADMPAEPDSK
jgi:tetratricopeptide (TPR) repeat protein/predicted Ser/Thr protein kinase